MKTFKLLLLGLLFSYTAQAQAGAVGSQIYVPPFTVSKVSAGTPAIDLTDTALSSIAWFSAYRAADFPEVTVSGATYFAIYGTDHDTGEGSIRWGTFSSLNLSDFAEQGEIWTGTDTANCATNGQTETPYLVREPNDPNSRPLYLYYHCKESPGQATMLITSAGGDLDAITWTDEGEVLPNDTATYGSNAHTGYATVERLSASSWRAFSLYASSGAAGGSRYAYWTSSDGQSWTLQNDVVYATRNPPGKGALGFPLHITAGGKLWGISGTEDPNYGGAAFMYAADRTDLDNPPQGPFIKLTQIGNTGSEGSNLRGRIRALLGADGLPYNDSGTYHLYYTTSDAAANNGGNKVFYATLTLQ